MDGMQIDPDYELHNVDGVLLNDEQYEYAWFEWLDNIPAEDDVMIIGTPAFDVWVSQNLDLRKAIAIKHSQYTHEDYLRMEADE